MSRRSERMGSVLLGVAVLAATVDLLALALAGVVERQLRALTTGRSAGWVDFAVSVLSTLVVLGLALLLVLQQRRHLIGWLLLVFASLECLEAVAERLGLLGLTGPTGAVPASAGWAKLSEAVQRPEAGVVFVVLLLFPTGRTLSARWVPLLWAVGMVFALWFVLSLFSPAPLQEAPFIGVVNPWGSPVFADAALRHAMTPIAAVVGLACLACLVVRFRASSGDERQQLRWVGLGAGLLPVCIAAVAVASLFGSTARDVVGDSVYVVFSLVLPLTVAVAVSRFRLYDLDLVVNGAVLYGLLTATLLALYSSTVLVLTRLAAGATSRSPWVVCVATLTVALAFGPVRRRLQAWLDRRFRRAEWNARERIREFGVRALDTPQPPTALRDLLANVCADPSLELGFWVRERGEYVDGDGVPLALPASGRSTHAITGPAAQPVALLLHAPVLDRNRRLLTVVVDAVGLLAENGRLQAELSAQVVEIQASRARIVAAADAERRQVERDLHDGAQQRLLGVALQVKLAHRRMNGDATARQALTEIGAEIEATILELRNLARGIHPAALDGGLGPALESMVARLPRDVGVDVTVARVEPLIELTAYYVACEAVANAVKHAGAASLGISAAHRDGVLRLDVHDDGPGGAAPAPGSGLTGLLDRVATVGGQLVIVSPAGGGTTVTAMFPCGC